MTRFPILLALLLPAAADAPAIRPGEWANVVTVRELEAPGAPAFLLRMARGRSKTERMCIAADAAATGPVALLRPDPKAKCTVASQQLAGGRYTQVLMCPQKNGPPLRAERTGRYDANGLVGQVTIAGMRAKGAFRFVGDQRVAFGRATCR